jgi:glycosyltransferase involved in cell wall biosynthesis
MRSGVRFHEEAMQQVLITGGHEKVSGGLEMFIGRAQECLGLAVPHFTETPGYGGLKLGSYLFALIGFMRRLPSHRIVWLQLGSVFDLAYLLLAKLFGKKVAVTPHLGSSWRSMRNPILRKLAFRCLGLADVIFTLHKSQSDALGFPPALAARCRVMGTFLPKELLEDPIPPRKRSGPIKLIHAARLSREKGSFAFLETCAALSRSGVEYEAVIVGNGDLHITAALAKEIARRNLSVRLLGPLPQWAFAALLRDQDVLVNLSLQDAYPLTVIEALLCSVAPVVSRLPGTEELAEETSAISLVDGQDGEVASARILALDWGMVPDATEMLRGKFTWSTLRLRYGEAFAALAQPRSSAVTTIRVPQS